MNVLKRLLLSIGILAASVTAYATPIYTQQNPSATQAGAFNVVGGTITTKLSLPFLSPSSYVQTDAQGNLVTPSPGVTNFIQNRSGLQAGATAYPDFLYVGSSAVVRGPFSATGTVVLAGAGNSVTISSNVITPGTTIYGSGEIVLGVPGHSVTVSTIVSMGSQKITNLLNGTTTQDAAAFGQVPTFTQWAAYTPTVAGGGTVSNVDFFWRREADSVRIRGSFKTGTVSATTASFSLPSGITILNSKIQTNTANTAIAGHWYSAAGVLFGGGDASGALFADGSDTGNLYFTRTGAAGSGLTKQAGNVVWGSTSFIMFNIEMAVNQ